MPGTRAGPKTNSKAHHYYSMFCISAAGLHCCADDHSRVDTFDSVTTG